MMPTGRSALAAIGLLLFGLGGVRAAEEATGFEPFLSQAIRGGQPPRHVKLRVAGVKQLSLIAKGVPNYRSAHADWADARLIAADGAITYLSDLKPLSVFQPYGTMQRDQSHRGGPLRIAQRQFRRGLGTHAYSDIRFALDGKYEWFEAWIGLDVTAGADGRVQFAVTDRPDPDPAGRLGPLQRSSQTTPPSDASWWKNVNVTALRRAIADLAESFPQRYPHGRRFLAKLDELEESIAGRTPTAQQEQALSALRQEALLANPLLDFDKLLLVKRRPIQGGKPVSADVSFGWEMGLPRSSMGNSSLPQGCYDNEIAVLSPVGPSGRLRTVYRPGGQKFVGNVDLHFDAGRVLFSMRDGRGRWQIFEIGTDGRRLRQVTRGDQPDVDCYDACYLPDGGIVFNSSACFQGVPCNKSHVAVLYRAEADGRSVRQLCFEQDHDFNPCMLPSGRVLYLRWEYSDLPHAHSRYLFSMNPDGTGQMQYYGGSSYWPNSLFAARPIPDRPGRFCGIVAGHHGSHREGELVLFDVGRGRREADGVIQRIPGYGQQVQPLVRDELTAASWPKFCHPYPLGEKYLLVTCKLHARSPWDLCLVDVFDNIVPLHHVDGYALMEPIPLRKTETPPVIPSRVDPDRRDAVVYMADVYRGEGLRGMPRGTVKKLRLLTYHYAYQDMGGLLGVVGLDGPWDIKRVLGTVTVEPDGSARFRVPANTPISLQPLDEAGKALQLMRSWLVGMPGETVSCVGCHEPQSSTPPVLDSMAARRRPSEITPWYGPPRNFSFRREVQPVIDRHCVSCHDGKTTDDGPAIADLRGVRLTGDYRSHIAGNGGGAGGKHFSVGYFELSRYVRRPGIESDIHMLPPAEYHADTTQLVQLLAKGHYNVRLDPQDWDRLVTWIDLNAPYHGTWTEVGWDPGPQRRRRRELRRLYAGVDEDPEALKDVRPPQVVPVLPKPVPDAAPQEIECPGWPFDERQAAKRQAAGGERIEPEDGLTLEMVWIPPGEFLMGAAGGFADERPITRVKIERPFRISAHEITNAQYALFDPAHDSRFESKNGYQFGVTGFELNRPRQPVVRVSWDRAMDFCGWLSRRSGRRFTLPTEAQWEYACRAGTATAMSYGELGHDFSPFANLADAALRGFVTDPYTVYKPLAVLTKYDDWIPKDARYDDRGLVTVAVGSYRPNAWGLYDLHGNVAEWTRTTYRPYPYDPHDGRDAVSSHGRKVVRGGSWRDRPGRSRSAFRLSYPAWQGVYNVGFRVVYHN